MDKKETKRKLRETRRENRKLLKATKIERAYGNIVMRSCAKHQPNLESLYEEYKMKLRDSRHTMLIGCAFGGFGLAMACLGEFVFGCMDLIMALQWFATSERYSMKADLLRHEFLQYADVKTIERAYEDITGKKHCKKCEKRRKTCEKGTCNVSND